MHPVLTLFFFFRNCSKTEIRKLNKRRSHNEGMIKAAVAENKITI